MWYIEFVAKVFFAAFLFTSLSLFMRSHFLNIITLGLFTGALLCFAGEAFAQYPGFGDPGSRQSGSSGGGLLPVSPNVDGGSIPIGATGQVVVRFRNDGSQPVQTGLIRLYPSSTVSGKISLNQCEEGQLAPGAECAIAVSVKGLQAGPWRLEMLMSHSGRSRLVTATLSGLVEPTGEGASSLTSDVEAIPESLDFGSLTSSQTLIEPIILRNITSTPIDIEDIYIDTSEQAGYALKTECKKLDAGQACIAIVTWSPKMPGRSSGVLVIEHTGSTALASVPLSGEYSPKDVGQADVFPQAVPGRGLLVSSQTELDFGSNVETASTITVSLVNAGDADLTIEDIRISGSDNGLSFKGGGCLSETVLEPIEACPLTVTWSPTRVGSLYDDIQIVHSGARGILVLPIRGSSTSTVSQDQKSIILSGDASDIPATSGYTTSLSGEIIKDSSISAQQAAAATRNVGAVVPGATFSASIMNPLSVLDGYKITSFSPTRAIINGPGGSRLVFGNEEVVLGGVPWFVLIQNNGIEFLHQGQRVLLLFDRSLSSINRVTASSDSEDSSALSSSDNSNSSGE